VPSEITERVKTNSSSKENLILQFYVHSLYIILKLLGHTKGFHRKQNDQGITVRFLALATILSPLRHPGQLRGHPNFYSMGSRVPFVRSKVVMAMKLPTLPYSFMALC
jgi:hypothetical protein